MTHAKRRLSYGACLAQPWPEQAYLNPTLRAVSGGNTFPVSRRTSTELDSQLDDTIGCWRFLAFVPCHQTAKVAPLRVACEAWMDGS